MDSFFKREAVKMSTLTNLSHLSKGTKNHLKNVYACLSLSLLCAAGGAYLNMMMHFIVGGGFLPLIVTFGCMMWLHATPHTPENLIKRLAILSGLAFLIGASAAPLLNLALKINPAIIMTAFVTTSSIFACFTLSALLARRRTYLFLGGICSSVAMIMMLGLLFGGAQTEGSLKVYLYLGVALTLAFILYDTQVIIEKQINGDNDFVMHSVTLFIDFVNLFQHLLSILALNEEDKKRKRRS